MLRVRWFDFGRFPGFGLAAAILVAVPFLDRRASKDEPSPAFTVLGLVALLYLCMSIPLILMVGALEKRFGRK